MLGLMIEVFSPRKSWWVVVTKRKYLPFLREKRDIIAVISRNFVAKLPGIELIQPIHTRLLR